MLKSTADLLLEKCKLDYEQRNFFRANEMHYSFRDAEKKLEEKIINANNETARAQLDASLAREQLADFKARIVEIVEAQVNSRCGQYEKQYFHDLHTNLEERSDSMQKFLEGAFEKILSAVKDSKPSFAEPKIFFVGKEAFGLDEKMAPKKEEKAVQQPKKSE